MNSFLNELQRRAGGDADDLLRTAHAALCLLAPSLSEYGRRAAARTVAALGSEASALEPGADAVTSAADLVDRTAARARVSRGRAAEVAMVVAAVLGEGENAVRFLAPDCPPDVSDLFFGHPEARAVPRPAPHPAEPHVVDERRTLSSGRPGALHPLAGTHPTAQHGSVAEQVPHGVSKLSSGATTLERAAKTLATGAPKGEPLL